MADAQRPSLRFRSPFIDIGCAVFPHPAPRCLQQGRTYSTIRHNEALCPVAMGQGETLRETCLKDQT